ncbi:MAG: DUF4160 domain-containing protein [Cyclobacteriaceae bacterium]
MPTILRIGPYRFYFYSADGDEPTHVHVQRDDYTAKFWVNPVRLDKNLGFRNKEINELFRMIEENQLFIIEKWNEYFN